ncbi:helix-turn-helix transcriptional regulator [Streptomyces sp. NPDC019396]|uniref:helix-turn-helix domain-containing protein n=1 Tax=Streptomyces sp. NPDC019396 TaxID=3154687 RepID=UPI003400526B
MARSENKETASAATRMVADMIRKMRLRAGLSQPELGTRIGYSAAAVSAAETCAQAPSDAMLVALEREVGDGLGFFEDARAPLRREKYPRQFRDYSGLEQKALVLRLFATLVVHGLFQTPEYARALIGGGFPPLPDERVEQLVEARTARQALFDRQPVPLIELVLEESVLRRTIGSAEIMRDQLTFLAKCAQRRNVTLQVLPLDAGVGGEFAGAYGNLNLVETPEHDHLVYLEIQDESLMINDPAKVSTYAQRYAKIRSQALGPRESLGRIEQLAGEER